MLVMQLPTHKKWLVKSTNCKKAKTFTISQAFLHVPYWLLGGRAKRFRQLGKVEKFLVLGQAQRPDFVNSGTSLGRTLSHGSFEAA